MTLRDEKALAALTLVLASLLLAGLVGACATNPATGKKMFSLVSEEEEAQMGLQAHPGILAEFGVYDDPELSDFVQNLGRKLALRSELPELDWHFTVLDSPVVNAFALPGGYIYVTRGLLAHADSEAQLAGVLGHEIGHVTARHSAQQMSRQQALGLGVGLGAILSPEFARFGGLAQQGLGLLMLKYGRGQEEQADELGIRYALRAGYDPRKLSGFFEVLDRQERRAGGDTLPDWLSTHPAPENRVEDTRRIAREKVKERGGKRSLVVGRAEYLVRIDGLVFGEDPRQGYTEGRTFYHPEMRFVITFPKGWLVLNSPSAVISADSREETTAVLRLTLGRAKEGEGPEAYLRRSVAKAEGMRLDDGRSETVNGLPAYLATARFADGQGGERRAFVAALLYQGAMYEFVGQTTASTYGSHRGSFAEVVRSFDRLDDRAKLEVEPLRVEITTAPRDESFGEFLDSLGSLPVEPQELAILNQLRRRDAVSEGMPLKLLSR
jgi:predicted Zn-dependent protease